MAPGHSGYLEHLHPEKGWQTLSAKLADRRHLMCFALDDVEQKRPLLNLDIEGAVVQPAPDHGRESLCILPRSKAIFSNKQDSFVFRAPNADSYKDWLKGLLEVKGVRTHVKGEEAPEQPGRCFKATLADALQNSHKYRNVPDVCGDCVEYLIEHGLQAQGLFRVAGTKSNILEIRKAYEEGGHPTLDSVHDASGVLKLYFREMTEPLIPHRHYAGFLACCMSPEIASRDVPTKIKYLQRMISLLPEENITLLRYLCQFLHLVSTFSEVNMMECSNLAIVFAPNILRPLEETPMTMMEEMPVTYMVLTLIIEQQAVLFGEERVTPELASLNTGDSMLTITADYPHKNRINNQSSMFGVLERRDGEDKWKKKHCIVSREECTLKLFSLRDKQRKKPTTLDLAGATVSPAPPQDFGYEVFFLELAATGAASSSSSAASSSSSSSTRFVLRAPGRDEYTRWLDCLISVIAGPKVHKLDSPRGPTTPRGAAAGGGVSAGGGGADVGTDGSTLPVKLVRPLPRLPPNFATYFHLKAGIEWERRYCVVANAVRKLLVYRDETKAKLLFEVDVYGAIIQPCPFEQYNRGGVFTIRPPASNLSVVFCGQDDRQRDIFVQTLADLSTKRKTYSVMVTESVFEGKLHVQRPGLFGAKWEENKWCVLTALPPTGKDGETQPPGGYLTMHKGKHKKPQATIPLLGACSLSFPGSHTPRGSLCTAADPGSTGSTAIDPKVPYPFTLTVAMQGKGIETHQLCALTVHDREDWIAALTAVSLGEAWTKPGAATKVRKKKPGGEAPAMPCVGEEDENAEDVEAAEEATEAANEHGGGANGGEGTERTVVTAVTEAEKESKNVEESVEEKEAENVNVETVENDPLEDVPEAVKHADTPEAEQTPEAARNTQAEEGRKTATSNPPCLPTSPPPALTEEDFSAGGISM